MGRGSVSIDQLASAIMEGLDEYAETVSQNVKKAVKQAGNTVKQDIAANAPARTGKYAKSWRTKTTKESSQSLEVTVYSPTRYMLAHLLEHGHAKRNGGRVKAIPHIAPAEAHGETQLIENIKRGITHG